jgi:hypothetical protein
MIITKQTNEEGWWLEKTNLVSVLIKSYEKFKNSIQLFKNSPLPLKIRTLQIYLEPTNQGQSLKLPAITLQV